MYVENTKEAIGGFLNPFDMGTDELGMVSWGAPASTDVEHDVLRAEMAEKGHEDRFVANSLNTGSDFSLIKQLKLKTFENMRSKSMELSINNILIQYTHQGNVAFHPLMRCPRNPDSKVDPRDLLTYPLTAVPYGLATTDGYFAKTDKAKSYNHVTRDLISRMQH